MSAELVHLENSLKRLHGGEVGKVVIDSTVELSIGFRAVEGKNNSTKMSEWIWVGSSFWRLSKDGMPVTEATLNDPAESESVAARGILEALVGQHLVSHRFEPTPGDLRLEFTGQNILITTTVKNDQAAWRARIGAFVFDIFSNYKIEITASDTTI